MNTNQTTSGISTIHSANELGATSSTSSLPSSDISLNQLSAVQKELPLLDPKTIDFTSGLKVVNRTNRFVIPVPALADGGELLVFPGGTEKAGEVLKEAQDGSPDRGIVFYNGKDSAWQSARGNGREVILVNDVTPEQAVSLENKLQEQGGRNITLEGLNALLTYARNEIGIVDFYHKKMSAVEQEMKAADSKMPRYVTVTKPTVHSAVYIAEEFSFDGPVKQSYPKGAVLLNDGKHTWGIATDVFLRNFKTTTDGGERALGDIRSEFPQANQQSYVRRITRDLENYLSKGIFRQPLLTYSDNEDYCTALGKAIDQFNGRHPEYEARYESWPDERDLHAIGFSIRRRHPFKDLASSSMNLLKRLVRPVSRAANENDSK